MKICSSCSAEYGVLADYCGRCGAKLPKAAISAELREQKEQNNRILCTSEQGHTLQLDFTEKPRFCIACGSPLPALH